MSRNSITSFDSYAALQAAPREARRALYRGLRKMYSKSLELGKYGEVNLPEPRHGACSNLRYIVHNMIDRDVYWADAVMAYGTYAELWKGWPAHSGNSMYPVPETTISNKQWVGMYGALRRDMIQHAMRKLEQMGI